ncbi:hypothetical protein TWF106_005950 [Orbilia oligospora]|uniref:Uncharacterized protein n=1 Tax=Orbilia oligospora TaxID=2813651 RepID=A0A7C8TVP4_ORBOL|nr:hypothetical protein TWF788_006830 [Orbilia oligospora]KAF3205938.1 hypothetical protein TWF679_009118 [Orbilia oligospora]KAF3221661.1 hypothetical protein TWF106_005950 [Orbilia oligospora]
MPRCVLGTRPKANLSFSSSSFSSSSSSSFFDSSSCDIGRAPRRQTSLMADSSSYDYAELIGVLTFSRGKSPPRLESFFKSSHAYGPRRRIATPGCQNEHATAAVSERFDATACSHAEPAPRLVYPAPSLKP